MLSKSIEPIAYTMTEAVAVSPFGRTTLYHLIKAGEIQAKKVGSRTYIMRAELERFLSEQSAV